MTCGAMQVGTNKAYPTYRASQKPRTHLRTTTLGRDGATMRAPSGSTITPSCRVRPNARTPYFWSRGPCGAFCSAVETTLIRLPSSQRCVGGCADQILSGQVPRLATRHRTAGVNCIACVVGVFAARRMTASSTPPLPSHSSFARVHLQHTLSGVGLPKTKCMRQGAVKLNIFISSTALLL